MPLADALGAPRGLTRKAVSASGIEGVAFGAVQVLRLISSMILTRLLFPEAFGVMAMLGLVLYGLHMLSDVGILQVVVQSPRGEQPSFLHTAFTLQILRGLWLWAVASALAWPVALLFREAALVWIIPVGALSAVVSGFTSMRLCALRRDMRSSPIALLELASQFIGMLTTIFAAHVLGLGVWALVTGSLANSLAHTAGSYMLAHPHRDRLAWDREARAEIFSFGRWIFASSAVTFFAGRGDQFLLGRLLGTSNLGVYNIALTLAEAPEELGNRVMRSALYPAYARVLHERPEHIARVYYRSRLGFDAVMQTSIGGLCAIAPWLIASLYDSRYHAASGMLQLLSLRAALTMMALPCESALTARGLASYGLHSKLVLAAGVLVLIPLGYAWASTPGVLWAMVATRLLSLLALWPAAWAHGMLRFRRELLVPVFLSLGYFLGSGWLWILRSF